MALTLRLILTDNFGEQIAFENAYVRVEQVLAKRTEATLDVGFYRGKDLQKLSQKDFNFAPNLEIDANHIKQAYLHLKTLPEFADAVDC